MCKTLRIAKIIFRKIAKFYTVDGDALLHSGGDGAAPTHASCSKNRFINSSKVNNFPPMSLYYYTKIYLYVKKMAINRFGLHCFISSPRSHRQFIIDDIHIKSLVKYTHTIKPYDFLIFAVHVTLCRKCSIHDNRF